MNEVACITLKSRYYTEDCITLKSSEGLAALWPASFSVMNERKKQIRGNKYTKQQKNLTHRPVREKSRRKVKDIQYDVHFCWQQFDSECSKYCNLEIKKQFSQHVAWYVYCNLFLLWFDYSLSTVLRLCCARSCVSCRKPNQQAFGCGSFDQVGQFLIDLSLLGDVKHHF